MTPLRRFLRVARALCLTASFLALVAGCQSHFGATASQSASAGATAQIPLGRSTQTMTVDGAKRTVHLYRPSGLTSQAPLVVMLHGGYGNGVQAETSYHWDPEADAGHFLLALPDGIGASWNAGGGCCGKAQSGNVDDVAFLTQMVTMLRQEIGIDPDRIYIAGVSNGGIMAYRMACETDIFAAVGADSATMLVPCGTAEPASVLHIHGTADPIIPYQGGTGEAYNPLTGRSITTPPILTVNADWRATDHCAAPAVATKGVLTTSVATCPNGKTVELITIAGAGHGWPGGDKDPVTEKLFHTGAPSTALNATEVIWQFFAAHPK